MCSITFAMFNRCAYVGEAGAMMTERRRVVDGRGRTWTISKVPWQEAEEEDFRFWYDRLTPEERVEAVAEALEGCLKARGLDAVPRLRRVHRRIRAPWAKPHGAQTPRRQVHGEARPGKPTKTRRAVSLRRPEQKLRRA
jgi:hypothetical protein